MILPFIKLAQMTKLKEVQNEILFPYSSINSTRKKIKRFIGSYFLIENLVMMMR